MRPGSFLAESLWEPSRSVRSEWLSCRKVPGSQHASQPACEKLLAGWQVRLLPTAHAPVNVDRLSVDMFCEVAE